VVLSFHDFVGDGRDLLLLHGGADNIEWLGVRHHIHWDHPDEVAARILEPA
jgi:hypothetical protein